MFGRDFVVRLEILLYVWRFCCMFVSDVVVLVVSVRASNTDKALVFVGLFLTLLILFTLVAMLYCVAK